MTSCEHSGGPPGAALPVRPLGRLLLLTGMRHDEAAGGRWGEIDLNAGRWTVPPPRHKSETGHLVPLVDHVVAKLRDLPRFKRGDFVFTATGGEKSTWFSDKMKKKLDGRMLRTLKAMARKSGKNRGGSRLFRGCSTICAVRFGRI